jgi:hypothetical protein
MTIKLKKFFQKIFYVTTVLFLILVALNTPQKSNVDFQRENVAALTEKNQNTNLN